MARLDVTGMQDALRSLARMGKEIGPTADAMLHAAGAVVTEGWQYSAAKNKHYRTGALYESIKTSKPKTINGVRSVYVSPTGTDKYNRIKAVRNAEKGFVLNYGRENMKASHWADEGDEISAKPAADAMLTVYDEFLETGRSPTANGGGETAWSYGGAIGTATYHQG